MKSKLAIAAIVMTMIMGCNKLKHIPFEYSYHKYITVPQAPIPGTTLTIPVSIRTNIDSVMEANKTKPGLLESAKLKTLALSVYQPAGGTFGVLRSIDIYVTDGSNDILIASQHDIPASATSLDMAVNDVELKPYLTAQNMNLKATVTTATGMTQEMTLYFDMRIRFEANLLEAF